MDLWIPRNARPKHQCNVCDSKFYETDDYVRHVTKCAAAHRGELLEVAERHREEAKADPFIHGEPFDPEALEWVERQRRAA